MKPKKNPNKYNKNYKPELIAIEWSLIVMTGIFGLLCVLIVLMENDVL